MSAFMLDSTEDYCTWILRILGTCFALITLIFIKKKKVLLGVVCLFLAGIYFWRANVLGKEIREREKKYEIAAKIEIEKEKLILFTKVGAIVLTSLLLLATSIHFYPQTVATLNTKLGQGIAAKELPIYCVDKGEEKKIALSFDAAWGNS